jgi:RimJ/RimL family protein N-acetyltransferase
MQKYTVSNLTVAIQETTMNFWQGQTVRLRGVEPTDAETFFQWNLDSEMGRNLDFLWPPISQALVRKQVEEQAIKLAEGDDFQWIIEDRTRLAVGAMNTHDCNRRNGTFSYGINIAPDQQRKGYASAAIQLVLKYYFEELRYQKVHVNVASHNQASITLHERLGFVKEGVLRQMIYTGGLYFDVLCYGLTKAEWDASLLKL